MVSGGKPLWIVELFTTFCTFFFAIFFLGIVSSWASGISKEVLAPYQGGKEAGDEEIFDWWPKGKPTDGFIVELTNFQATLRGWAPYVNLGVGLVTGIAGLVLGYFMYRRRVRVLYAKIWIGLVVTYTMVWMVSAVVTFVDLEEIVSVLTVAPRSVCGKAPPGACHQPDQYPRVLKNLLKWGFDNRGLTIGLFIAFPTLLFSFFSFAAYRLFVKLDLYGNTAPDKPAGEYAPGSWVERQSAAEGGHWSRTESAKLIDSQLVDEPGYTKEPSSEAHMARDNSMTGGWGQWLDDLFDYRF